MPSPPSPPLISVVLATRDRPALFEEALDSVLAQHDARLEVVVVNDGSSAQHMDAYEAVWARASARLGARFQSHTLVHRPRGHGQSYALNFGVARAQGDYVCFLDDDDKWTDPGHLARLTHAIEQASARGQALDLFMTNQDAWSVRGERIGTLWLGALASELQARGRQPDHLGCYPVTVDDLIASAGFCHINCLGVRRALYEQVGGMDEGIRWECDRDLFLKLVETAGLILHHPDVVSYHRVPDPTKALNMTTAMGMVDKRLLQCLVMDKALARARHPAILRHARLHKGFALKKIATAFAAQNDWASASFYARQALGAAPGLKWAGYTLQCMLRAGLGSAS